MNSLCGTIVTHEEILPTVTHKEILLRKQKKEEPNRKKKIQEQEQEQYKISKNVDFIMGKLPTELQMEVLSYIPINMTYSKVRLSPLYTTKENRRNIRLKEKRRNIHPLIYYSLNAVSFTIMSFAYFMRRFKLPYHHREGQKLQGGVRKFKELENLNRWNYYCYYGRFIFLYYCYYYYNILYISTSRVRSRFPSDGPSSNDFLDYDST